MMNLTSKTSKSLLLFKRALVLLCFVLCSLMANANGTQWYPKYSVNIGVADGSTGSGKVYINAKGYTNANKRAENDPGYDTEDNPTEASIEVSASNFATQDLFLEKKLTVEGTKNNKKIWEVWKPDYVAPWAYIYYKYTNVTLRAVANPGSKFEGWTVSSTSTDATIIIDEEEEYARPKDANDNARILNSNILTYKPIFTIRTYYYKIPGAESDDGGMVYRSTDGVRPNDASTSWQTSIATGDLQYQDADESGKVGYATIRTYYHAKPEDGYTFVGWYDSSGEELSKSLDYEHQMLATSENSSAPTTTTLKALFVVSNGVPEITYQNVGTVELYTGTETAGSFPYHKDGKRKINLSATFGTDNKPLFDYLYIFGVTTNVNGDKAINNTLASLTTPCNALTPLYIYHSDGEKYILTEIYNAATKRFDYDATSIETGKKFYFTGYCPFANIGRTVDDEGWMYFEGNQSSPVDIYLEDCQIYGRFRSSDGSQNTGKYPYNEVLIAADVGDVLQGKENINHMKGFSSIFVFHSTATNSGAPYKPTIHIRGNNHLKGQLGYINEVFAYVLGTKISMEQIVGAPLRSIGTSSAPITIKSSNSNGYTHLTMDDFWPTSSTTTEPTNGYLKLDTYPLGEASRVPSIDMGSEYSSLTFNGGQYNLHNSAAPDGEYTCNMAISHRKFYKSAEVLGRDVKVSLYGFGGDKTTNQVIINSGTFTMEKNMYGTLGGSYYIDQDKFLDLRLPAGNNKSQINGGAFNGISNVVFCSEVASSGGSPVNATGYWLCLQDVTVNDPTQKTSYGSNEFTIPSNWSSYYTDIAYDVQGNYDEVTVTNDVYGGQSVNVYTKEGNSIVTLLLPGEEYCGAGGCDECEKLEESLYRNWATTIPLIDLTIAGVDASIGGDEEVPYKKDGGESTLDYKVNQLMYMDLEGYQNSTIEIGDSKFTIANSDKTRGNFTNEKPYTILKHLNLLKVVQADHWYTFVAPFNIHKVEVLELDEDKIEKLSGKEEAMQAQIQATAKFLMDNNGLFLPNTEGRSSGLTLEEIVMLSPEIQKKELIPLYHYNGQKVADNNYGKNILEANYYLYEAPEGEFDKTETKNGLDTFHIVWEPVHREGEAGQPLMKQGRVYAIQFPYCPMCAEVTTNDYWSNKMIRFYGAGYGKDGQTINGTEYQNTILATSPSEGNAMFKGNSTLADMTLDAADKAYVHNMANDYFVLNTSDDYPLKPTEGFMLYNPGQASMPARISRSGQIEYDENVETGLPTIAGRNSLMLFGAYDGIEVLALHEQLVTVYNLQGNIIFQQYMAEGQQVYVATGAGVFIVRGESETIKVMVE